MLTQDDLAALFQEQLSLHSKIIQTSLKEEVKAEQPVFYSISQHYHHSAHVTPDPPVKDSEETLRGQSNSQITLKSNNVCLSSINQSQIELFKAADASQQKRLIELWRIFYPGFRFNTPIQGFWQEPLYHAHEESLEETQLREQTVRIPKLEADGDYCMEDDIIDEPSAVVPYCPIQNENRQWCQDNYAELHKTEAFTQLEFERLSNPGTCVANFIGGISHYSHSTDPVYNRVG